TLLPDVLRYAGRRDPKLRLLVQQGSNQELFDLLSRGALDAILCYATPSFKGIAVRPLFHEDLYLIGVPGAAAVSRGDVDFDRAAGLPLVLDPRSHIGRCQIDRVARRRKVPLNLVAEIEPLEAKRSMMVERGCYTILPYGSIVDEAAAGMLAAARIVNPGLMLTLSLIVPRWVPADVERVLLKVIRPVVRDKIAARTLRWQPAGATIRAAR
ncbi:MAG: LysR substrate-binding domain-containing protein, partial [Candidatus Eiseniibacteriota bacterium]